MERDRPARARVRAPVLALARAVGRAARERERRDPGGLDPRRHGRRAAGGAPGHARRDGGAGARGRRPGAGGHLLGAAGRARALRRRLRRALDDRARVAERGDGRAPGAGALADRDDGRAGRRRRAGLRRACSCSASAWRRRSPSPPSVTALLAAGLALERSASGRGDATERVTSRRSAAPLASGVSPPASP